MKLALAMIVKGTNDEAYLLDRCLKNLSGTVDGIFITRTHLPGQKPNRRVGEVASKYGTHLSDFEWCYDFAKARNFNFSQVPKDFDYIMWTDADDMWRGLDKLRPTLKDNASVDAYGFWYLYDWDEFRTPVVVHRKTMIVKNDGCVKWEGAIHEDLMETRQLDVKLIEGIERLHLSSAERVAEASLRNVVISEKALKANPDDPRSHWNLANSQFGANQADAAIKTFHEFIELTHSEDERYLARTRLADILKAQGKYEEAVKQLQNAIGMSPGFPDAYLQLAHLYYTMKNYEGAEEYCIRGLKLRPQTNKLIVYNPRDYDYNPMMLLAQIYASTNRPDLMLPMLKGCLKIYPNDERLQRLVKEGQETKDEMALALETILKLQKIKDPKKLKKAIDKLPIEIKSHPALVILHNQNFIKTESSGKDLVIYCGNTAHTWNPELFKTKGFGGSEEAVIHLAREYAMLGWNVTVYNNCGHKAVIETIEKTRPDEGLRPTIVYRPFWEWNYRDKQDVTILWRWVKPLDVEINCPKIFVDLHDVVPPGEFNEARLAKIDKIFVKSKFHRSLFPNVPDNKIVVIPNGFETYGEMPKSKDQYLIINTSSPDRSMDVVPAMFKEIKKRIPRAKMQWAYGWDTYESAHKHDAKKMKWMKDTIAAMDDAGIEQLGRLPQSEVAKLYAKAHIFFYPTEFAEIDCISVKKAQGALCKAITTDFGALKESNRFGIAIHSKKKKDNWNKPYQFHYGVEDEHLRDILIKAVVGEMKENFVPDRRLVGPWIETFKWSEIAKRWNAHL